MLQIPSSKEVYLVGPRREVFSMMGLSLWNIISAEITLTSTVTFFQKALEQG